MVVSEVIGTLCVVWLLPMLCEAAIFQLVSLSDGDGGFMKLVVALSNNMAHKAPRLSNLGSRTAL